MTFTMKLPTCHNFQSVPDGPEPVLVGSPQRAPPQASPTRPSPEQAVATVTLSESQTNKLRADLGVVEGNMAVMNDMLNELTSQPPAAHHPSDIELLNELADTLRAMQTRVAELVGRLAGESPLTAELLHANDRLNNLLLRHQRHVNNRNAVTGATPSAILGAAMGVPKNESPKKPEDDALIDLSDDVPDVAKLSVKDSQPDRSPGQASKDEFDMFAQSRNVTYETSKTGGSSYADNLEEQTGGSLAAAASQRATQGQPLPTGMDQREIDEIAAWLEQEKAATDANGAQESVTSSDFDKFLAERAAAAESLPNADNRAQSTPSQTPRHRQIKKEEQDSMFAL
ncbi:TOM1-like protein 2 [Ostrinia furnacalis]|uniref:TOM1-like protein 2 n=1 Tax=Ostrinia furnacalis TaxID=93504 RepID=UPI001040568C|nr:TOM1-like protein 2 [Ostrinia furnacalis]